MTEPLPAEEIRALKGQLVEARAAFDALVDGEVDSITAPSGQLLVRQAQQALQRSEVKFRALIEHLPNLVWVHREGNIVYANPNTLRSVDCGQAGELAPQVARAKSPYEVQVQGNDGTRVSIEVSDQPVIFEGEPATLCVGHDITERKRLEAHALVTGRMASIGMLAAGVAHEINNPLAFVLANLDFVAQEIARHVALAPADARDFVEASNALREAQAGAERVRTIVRDLKALSSADDGQRGVVDVQQTLNSTATMAGNEIRHRARLVKDYGPEPLQVAGNASQLGQVFLNLLINAAQAIPEGAAERNEIRIATRLDGKGRVVIDVTDTGSGMTAQTHRNLFTPFFTTKANGAGTGLGLSICHKIVAAHHGEIQVETELGKGSTFRVCLPAAHHPAVLSPVKLPRGPRGRVLIIDDEPMVGGALRRVLAVDHDSEVVTSGREALARLSLDDGFDVVFCDLMMPEMSGPQLYAALATLKPELASRVVFLTGGVFTDAARTFLQQTRNPTMEKPFKAEVMRAVVAQFVARRRPLAQANSPA